MEKSSYVVFSPSRTGSTLITYNLQDYLRKIGYHHSEIQVIHTHDKDIVLPHNNFVCILSRRNVPHAILSSLVLEQTGEWANYSNNPVAPFAVDPIKFQVLLNQHREFYEQIDLTPYKKVIDIWFEPLVSDPTYLFQQIFGVNEQTNYYNNLISPYNNTKLITNIEELKQVAIQNGFEEFE